MTKSDQYCICVRVDDAFAEFTPTCLLRKAVAATLQQFMDTPDNAGVTLLITDDKDVEKLNARFRQVDAPTDVLSFPSMTTEEDMFVTEEDTHYLGDIVIAYPYSAAQAADEGHKIGDVLALLAVHGTLHLLGFDHDTAASQAAMWAKQEVILPLIGVPLSVMPPLFEFPAGDEDDG